jgi:hypothetical protein
VTWDGSKNRLHLTIQTRDRPMGTKGYLMCQGGAFAALQDRKTAGFHHIFWVRHAGQGQGSWVHVSERHGEQDGGMFWVIFRVG